jgi:hypothetical protein
VARPVLSIGMPQIWLVAAETENAMRPFKAADTGVTLSVKEASLCEGPVTLVPSAETGTAAMYVASPTLWRISRREGSEIHWSRGTPGAS